MPRSCARAARPEKQSTAQSMLKVPRRQFEFINANIAARGHASTFSGSPLVMILAAKAGQRQSQFNPLFNVMNTQDAADYSRHLIVTGGLLFCRITMTLVLLFASITILLLRRAACHRSNLYRNTELHVLDRSVLQASR